MIEESKRRKYKVWLRKSDPDIYFQPITDFEEPDLSPLFDSLRKARGWHLMLDRKRDLWPLSSVFLEGSCGYYPKDLFYVFLGHEKRQLKKEPFLLNPHCPVELLREYKDAYPYEIIRNEKCPPDLLKHFVQSPSKFYLRNVAEHVNLNEEIAHMLFNIDPSNRYINVALAKNKNTPLDILLKLVKNTDPSVREQAFKRQELPPEIILEAIEHDAHRDVRLAAAANPSSPDTRLRKIITPY